MKEWIDIVFEPEDSSNAGEHIDLEDLARFAEGRTEPDERKKMIYHINRCSECYEILSETMTALSQDEQREAVELIKKRRQFFAIAASIILFVFMGSWMTYTTWFKAPLTAEVVIDKEFRDMLVHADTLLWTGKRAVKMAELLKAKGIQIKSFSKVILDKEYRPTRDFPPPKEILKITIKDNVAHITVVKEQNKE